MIVVEREREISDFQKLSLQFQEGRRGRSFSGPPQISLSMAKPPLFSRVPIYSGLEF
jgi:hypothetical protein